MKFANGTVWDKNKLKALAQTKMFSVAAADQPLITDQDLQSMMSAMASFTSNNNYGDLAANEGKFDTPYLLTANI